MNTDRQRCATNALRQRGDIWGLTIADLLAVPNGHHFHHGWHIGWTWSNDVDSEYLDILSEHRMPGMSARRVFPDGSETSLDTPHGFRLTSEIPEEDERLEREHSERNKLAYAALRDRGLLPPFGANIGSQDINEYLTSGNEPPE